MSNNNPLLNGIKETKNQNNSVLRVNNNPLLKNVKNTINNDVKNVNTTSVLRTRINAPKKFMNLTKTNKTDKQKDKWYNNFFKSSKAFNDDKNIIDTVGSTTSTALSSVGDLGLNIIEGFAQVPEQIGSLIAGAEAQVADWIGFDEHADNVRKRIANNGGALISTLAQRGEDKLDENSILGSTSDNVASGVGQVLSYFAGSKVPVVGSTISIGGKLNVPVTALLSGAGSGLTEAYQKENIKDWQAWTKAGGSGAIEGIVEGLFGTLGIGGSSFDDAITKSVSSRMKTGLTKALAQANIKATGEGLEEQISYIGNYFFNKGLDIMSEITGYTEVKFSEEWNNEEFWENFFVSGLSAMITQGGGTALNIARTQNQAIKDAEKQLNRNLTTEEKSNLKKHISLLVLQSVENDITLEEQSIVNNLVDNKINELRQSGKMLTSDEIIKLKNQTVNELKSRNIIINNSSNESTNKISLQETSPIYGTKSNNTTQENPLKTIFEEKIKLVKTETSPVYTQNIKVNNGINKSIEKNKKYIDLKDYNVSLKNDTINNILNNRGTKNEKLKNQNPIFLYETFNTPQVISNPDNVYQNDVNKYNKPNMYLQKNKSFVTTPNTLNALDSTSITNSDTALTNNIIPPKTNYVKNIKNPLLTNLKNKINLNESESEYLIENEQSNVQDKIYKPREIKSAIKKDFEISGYVNLNGVQINNPKQLAEITQIFRNPYYEITRILYFDANNTLLGYDSFSAHKVNESYATKDTSENAVENLQEKMENIGAKYIVHLHNHPSGNPKPSMQDLNVIERLKKYGIDVYGMVIDHNKYSYIRQDNSYYTDVINENSTEDFILDYIGKIGSVDELAQISINTQHKHKNLIVFVDNKNNIRSIQEVSNKFIKNVKFEQYIEEQKKITGSLKVYTSSKNSLIRPILEKYVKLNLLQDAYFEDTKKSLMQNEEIAKENTKNKENKKYTESEKIVFDDYSTVKRKESNIKITENGIKYVQINSNFFENVPDAERPKYLMNYIKENLAGKTIRTDDGTDIYILDKNDNRLGKLVYGNVAFDKRVGKEIEDKMGKNKVRFEIKSNIISNLEDIIKISEISKHKEDINNRHGEFAINGFDTRKSYIYDGKDIYKVEFDVAIDNNKKHNLYAIKGVQKKNSLHTMVTSNEASYTYRKSSDTNSITQNNSNVNDLHKNKMMDLNESNEKYSTSSEEKYITMDDGEKYNLEEYMSTFGASEDTFNIIYDMQNKLPKISLYTDLKKKYAKENYDNRIVEKVKKEVPANYQNRRTKSQWLSVAQKIGNNIQKEDIEKIAFHSWINEKPNNKENLNRQGQKFVKFTLEEWLENIQKGYDFKPIPNLPNTKNKSTKKADKNQPKWIETSFSNEQIRNNIKKSKFDDVTYIVQGNQDMVDKVNRKIEELGYDEAIKEIDKAFNKVDSDDTMLSKLKGSNYTNFNTEECVMAQRLLQMAIDKQDIEKAESLISQIALAGTRAGQSIQALSLINRLSPEGQLLHLQRTTERIENQIKNKMNIKKSEEKFIEETHKKAKSVVDKVQDEVKKHTKRSSKVYSILAKKLADKISYTVDYEEQKTNENIQKEIVKELYKLALESPIDIEKRIKTNSMTAVEKIKFALENKELYGDTWNQAKRILLKKYKQDADITTKLTNFFDKGIIPDYSMKTFKEAYEKSLNEIGYKTKKAIIKTLTDEAKNKVEYINNLRPDQQKDIIKKVTQNIINETGAKGNDANILAEQVVIEFFDSLKTNEIAELSKVVSKFKGIEITEEMKRKILSAKNINKLNEVMEEVKEELAKQIPPTIADKIRSWRYFSMLFNPQTHIRNMLGNIAMRIVSNGQKVVARGLETAFNSRLEERTRTFEKASDEIKKFAKEDVKRMMDTLTGENKLSMENKIMQKRKIFKNDKLDKLVKFNSELLEKEDMLALKTSYTKNFAEYLTANNIKNKQDIENNKEIVEKGRVFATQEALKSTFRSNSNLANLLQQMENRLGVSGQFLIGGLIPFKKTPINITKTALRYSPLGLIETITYESARLKKGEITATEFIDKISSGLTGTGLAILGMILFNAGIITAGSDDEKDEKYKQQLGWKPYAIRIGNTYYSLSWLSPTAIPIFIGAEITKNIQTDEELNIGAIAEGLGQALNPLMDMSMLQGINDALSSYNSDGLLGNIGNVAKTTVENYALQFIPTLSSKIASFTDSTKRTTTPSKNSEFKELESVGRRAMYKIPVLRNMLEPVKDIWGEDVKNSDNIITRFLENFVLPTYGSKYTESEVDEAILQLYSKTGDDSIIPTIPSSYFTYDGKKYEMSAEKYTQYKETYGKNLNKKIKTIITSDSYKKLSNEQKVDIVSSVFKYASEEAKKEYLNGQNIKYNYSTNHMLYNLSENFLDKNSTFKSLYYETKDTESLPTDTLNSFTYQDVTFKVTNEEKQSYAEDSYKVLSKIYTKLNNNSKFKKMSNDSKIKILQKVSSEYLSELKKKYRLQVMKRAIKNKEYEIAK